MAMGISDCKQHTRHQGPGRRAIRFLPLLAIFIVPGAVWSQANNQTETSNKTVLGVRNLPLRHGAELLLAGKYEKGVELTHEGLEQAFGFREEEAALSNLCAGYLQLGKYDTALQYCELLLARNDKSWRAYNNRALIYIKTKQWDKAEADLIKGEELNEGAYTMKVARSIYMDALYPVDPEIEIDDRETKGREKKKSN
jgi:tetratricopeptide (TPR) repeat protein